MADPISIEPSQRDKEAWRQEARARRRAMPAPDRAAASAEIQRLLLDSPFIRESRTVVLTASFGTEVHSHKLIAELLAAGKTLALPRVIHWRHELDLHVIDRFPDGFDRGDFGILEPNPQDFPQLLKPTEADVILVPALLYDRELYRIGYGGGYFDRLLGRAPQAHKIGIAFECQLIDRFEHQPWDRPVQRLCTETGFFAP